MRIARSISDRERRSTGVWFAAFGWVTVIAR
jgi:hypothetical protein